MVAFPAEDQDLQEDDDDDFQGTLGASMYALSFVFGIFFSLLFTFGTV